MSADMEKRCPVCRRHLVYIDCLDRDGERVRGWVCSRGHYVEGNEAAKNLQRETVAEARA